jgi:hypothetical protein
MIGRLERAAESQWFPGEQEVVAREIDDDGVGIPVPSHRSAGTIGG